MNAAYDKIQSYCFYCRQRDSEPGSAYRRPSFKRQNPFIQLLTEGKKLRENAKEKDWSDEEYLAKLKEIRQMNAKEKRLLYEKYGRARYV